MDSIDQIKLHDFRNAEMLKEKSPGHEICQDTRSGSSDGSGDTTSSGASGDGSSSGATVSNAEAYVGYNFLSN